MNEDVLMSYERIQFGKQTRYNPIRTLTPESLAWKLDMFEYGYLRDTAMMWEAMQRRDDVLMSVLPKRSDSVARQPFKVVTKNSSSRAKKHKKILDYFWSNMSATSCTDRNIMGGFPQLVEGMMDCVGKRYAVHHIVWQPSPQGLTARFFFVPLWYFENKTGQLRFLLQDFDVDGQPLGPGEWMISCGLGIMEVCSVLYILKHLPLKDWLLYSQRHGIPGTHGQTAAAPGSEGWKIMVQAVESVGQNFSCVTGLDDLIKKLDFTTNGELPMPKLVERVDRALATLARGADLSTMSGHGGSHGGGQGASLQGEETELLTARDCYRIEETLQEQVEKWVIFYACGDTDPQANIIIEKPESKDITKELSVDEYLAGTNFPQTWGDISERYDRPLPEGADPDTLLTITTPPKPQMPEQPPAQNAQSLPDLADFLEVITAGIDGGNAVAWQPIADRVTELLSANAEQYNALRLQLIDDLPELLKPTETDEVAIKAWQDSLSPSLLNGLTQKNA